VARVLALLVALVLGAGVVAAATVPASAVGSVVERPRITPMLDAYLPARPSGASPAVLFVHGGGWNKGSRRWWARHARELTEATGWPTFTVDYSLDADAPYLAQQSDVRSAVAWVRAHADELGVDPSRIGLVGSSAGGHLAMLVGTTGVGAKAVVSLAGVADLPGLLDARSPVAELAERMLRSTPAEEPARWRSLSPIAHVDAGDPPMLLVASQDDPLVPATQSTTMAAALRAAGVPTELVVLPGADHVLGSRTTGLVETYLRERL
jgi:acetyl esterase/lipase